MSKKYRDPDWLERKWLDEDMSKQEIADICGASTSTIRKYLNEDFPSIGVYDCPRESCDKSFKKERGLNFHITSVHENNSATNKYTKGNKKHHDPQWVQEKLEGGWHYDDIAEECSVASNTIRRVIRKENLGTFECSQDGCNQRYPTEGGLKQHLSKDHPEVDYEGYGLDDSEVKEKARKAREELIESGEGQYDPELMKENLAKAREEYDPEKHSEFMQERWEEKDPEDYHQRRDGWWEKYAESREDWGRQTHYNELTGNELDSEWELKVDTLLYQNDIEYENEKKTYTIGDTWNTPDFEGEDWVIEVKSYGGFRDDERYEGIGEYFVEEVDKTYILVAGENVDMPCDIRIEWENREHLLDVLKSI